MLPLICNRLQFLDVRIREVGLKLELRTLAQTRRSVCSSSFSLLLCLTLTTSASEAAWFKELPAPTTEMELPINLEAAKAGWELSPDLAVVRDEILQADTLERNAVGNGWIRSRTALPPGEFEVVARVRIADGATQQGMTLHVGASGPNNSPESDCSVSAYAIPQYSPSTLRIMAAFGTSTSQSYLSKTEIVRGQAAKLRLPNSGVWFAERFKQISPVLDADLREELEAAMSRVPPTKDTWFDLRVVVRSDAIQVYRDGFIVGELQPAGRVEGSVQILLSANIRVASLVVRRFVPRPEGFQPVPIEANCNARFGLKADSLPGGEASVNKIPFVFPRSLTGNNHVDISESLFHYRNEDGHYEGHVTWPGPQVLDPNRIRFAVPNRPYTRLWLVAAFDGQPDRVPIVTARFYRPSAGFPIDAVASVPAFNARRGEKGATRLPVKFADGKDANLWLVPIELDSVKIASEFRNEDFLSLELTKQVFPYRSYPDPANYSWFQGGLPSGVRIFAMTFEEAPVRFIASGNRWGNTYVAPEPPVWRVSLENLRSQKTDASVRVTVSDPYGKTSTYHRSVSLDPNAITLAEIPIATQVCGLHSVRTDVELSGIRSRPNTFSQEGTFVQLPPDTRKAGPSNSRWGLWNWVGAHGTNPNKEENLYINRAIGSRFCGVRDNDLRRQWGVSMSPQHLCYGPEKWAEKDPYDPAEYAKFSDDIGKRAAKMLEDTPDIPSFSIFTETAITYLMTYGIPPEYIGEPELKLTEDEQKRYKAFMVTFKAAVEGIRKHAPKAKIALGWCESNFAEPFLKEKTPKEWFDWIGVDSPQFERMPEMPIREVSPNRMWLLKQAMKKYGYEKVPVIHTESYYPSSHELALGARGSADSYVRSAVLSLALGSTTFANCWTLQDCGGYWGSQHYGCIGVLGREPEANPKPALTAFATMTRLLDNAQFDGFVPTGSHTVYCVRFATHGKKIYCLWSIRGPRPAKLHFDKFRDIIQTDENGNETRIAQYEPTATVTLSPTPFWITTPADAIIEKIEVDQASHAPQGSYVAAHLDSLDEPWTYDPGEYGSYATNHWGCPRFAGPMKLEVVDLADGHGKVWQVTLEKPAKERPLAAWYGVFRPEKPIQIPGRAAGLEVLVNGRSNWGRIVYEIEDAKGERFQSVGTRDDWNCDDVHSWSYFNFDGWQYVRFPLPHNEPGDNYRSADSVWWNHNAEGIVDLPVKLTRIIIELRTHNIYVDQLVEVPDRSVRLSRLVAYYGPGAVRDDAPIKLQRAAANIIATPKTDLASLPNPIHDLKQTGIGAPTPITKVAPPDHGYDGTRVELTIQPVEGAKEYRVYVSAHENGAGAQQMAKSEKPQVLVTGLRAEYPLFLFVTYLDKDGKESKPTDVKRVLLRDDFPMK